MSHFTVCRRCRELHGADVLFRTFLYFLENLRLVEARCADMLRALEKETTLTHFRGVDVATLAREGRSHKKKSLSHVNYQWIRATVHGSIGNLRVDGIFSFVTGLFVREWRHRPP